MLRLLGKPNDAVFIVRAQETIVECLPPHPFYKSHDFISQIVPALPVHMATQIDKQRTR